VGDVLHEACLRAIMSDQGGHGAGVVVAGNPGCVFQPA
jgi:hypothetical protein